MTQHNARVYRKGKTMKGVKYIIAVLVKGREGKGCE